MEATCAFRLQSSTWSGLEKSGTNPSGFLRVSQKDDRERDLQTLNLQNSRFRRSSVRSKHVTLAISCSVKKSTGSEFDFDTYTDVTLCSLLLFKIAIQMNF